MQVVAVGRTAETQHWAKLLIRLQMTHEPSLEGLKHSLSSLLGDPAIVFQHQNPLRNSVT